MGARMHADLGDLKRDLAKIAKKARPDMERVVRRAAVNGNRQAKKLARRKAGPHGKMYYKRLSAEMTGVLRWEYGPEGIPKTDFVGVGFRHGPPNTDLAQSLDIQAPKFHADVAKLPDRWFWPGAE